MKPITERIAKNYPDTKIDIYLTPCQYATGNEKDYALALPNVTKVFKPWQSILRIILPPWFIRLSKNTAVLFLGGDPKYSLLLGIKYGLDVYAYSENPLNNKQFKKVFLKKEVGDLMYSGCNQLTFEKKVILDKYQLEDKDYCLFFTSSRKKQFLLLISLYTQALKIIQEKDPDFCAILQISPFIDDKTLNKAKKTNDLSGFKIIRADSKELMSISKLLVSIPGTSTAEAMYLGLPMVMLLPLNKPGLLNFDGLTGILVKIPFLGFIIGKIASNIIKKKTKYFSIPNTIFGKNIVPEFVEKFSPQRIADIVIDLYNNTEALNIMQNELSKLKPEYDVADKILTEILSA